MNEFEKNNEIEKYLEESADQIRPNLVFKAELEEKLRAAHKPKKNLLPFFNRNRNMAANLFSALTGIAALAAVIVFMVWIFQVLRPQENFGNSEGSFCPVTPPNGSLPPGETVESKYYLGNGELWTTLWPDGRILMQPHNVEPDGSLSMKWSFVRGEGVSGPLTVEGRRLDAEAESLRAFITDGYGETGLQILALIFPTTGCWEVTGRVGDASLTFVTEVIYQTDETPMAEATPGVIIDPNATPSNTTEGGYDFRGGKLFLTQPLPESPASANIYAFMEDQPATLEEARALADQFGLTGGVYKTTSPQLPVMPGYVISDGKRILTVYTANYFTYAPDATLIARGFFGAPNEAAEPIIKDFLARNGFEFEFEIIGSDANGSYVIHQLSPDGHPMDFETFALQTTRITIGADGTVIYMEANLMNYDPTPIGSYAIISAQEALDAILTQDPQVGTMEAGFSSGGQTPQMWHREYPDDERVTISGSLTKYDPAETGKSPLLLLDGIQVIGNTVELETLNNYAFAQATGRFIVENGIRRFEVESVNTEALQSHLTGSLRDVGGQIILVSDENGEEYVVMDPPADLPLNTEVGVSYLVISGVITDNTMDWSSIQFFADANAMGGGGGGGGIGFFQINLSGSPVPFPTLIPAEEAFTPEELAASLQYLVQQGDTLESISAEFNVPAEDIMRANYMTDPYLGAGWMIVIPGVPAPSRSEGVRGIVQISIYVKPDGRQRTEYTFVTEEGPLYYQLVGENLESLQEVVNRPIAIWGGIRYDESGLPRLSLERYEVLYPGLQFQILRGTQELIERDGLQIVLFHHEGETYAQVSPSGAYPDSNYYADGEINLEVLMVPDETYAGYPAVRVFSSSPALDLITGKPLEPYPMAERLEPLPDPFGNNDTYVQPDLIIDSVELIYYSNDPKMQSDSPQVTDAVQYVQPVWRFHGRYTSGGEAIIFVQALTKEYLLPVFQGVLPPG